MSAPLDRTGIDPGWKQACWTRTDWHIKPEHAGHHRTKLHQEREGPTKPPYHDRQDEFAPTAQAITIMLNHARKAGRLEPDRFQLEP